MLDSFEVECCATDRKGKEWKSYLSCGESGVEGHNGEHIDEEDDHARDGDRAGEIPHRVLGRSLV